MISMQKSTVKDETIFTDAIIKQIVQQYSLLYSLNAIFFIAVKLKRTNDVVMSWCIGQKLGACTVLTKINKICYIPENESEQDILGWNKSYSLFSVLLICFYMLKV